MAHRPTLETPGPLPALPPEGSPALIRLARLARRPIDQFLQIEAASGILLLVAAAVALAWANSPWAASYTALWQTQVGLSIGTWSFARSLEWIVNDGLMVIFFFVVGLEIRREIHQGELSEWRRAALPAAAALGGMLAPAGLYLLVVGDGAARAGWGVPMATDIAFAVGILALLGKRVPPALRVLLLALAVIDDLGAILVIAIFYSSGIAVTGFLVAALGLVGIVAMQRFGVRHKLLYVAPALVVWGGIYAAGVHPTIAGVIVGLLTPVRAWLGPEGFVDGVQRELTHLTSVAPDTSSHEIATHLRHVDRARREAQSPATSLIEMLHPWVAYAIMPLFALANAGVAVSTGALDATATRVIAGVVLGLVAGKTVGVVGAALLTVKLGVATLPRGVTLRHVLVLGVVAGVGFTMALFVAQLAFATPELLAAGKLGVLAASAVAGILALALGAALLRPTPTPGEAPTAHDAERSTDM